MDRITKSLLDEFSREHDLGKLLEEKQFEHFAAYLTAGRHLSEAFDTSDIVTGSGGDTGIDGIAVIVNGSLIDDADLVKDYADRNGYLDVSFVFVQTERSSRFESPKIGHFTFGVQDFFKETPTLKRNKEVTSAAKIMSEVYHRSSKFKRGNPTCKLYYVTSGTWVKDETLEGRRKAAVDDLSALRLFRDVEFIPIDASGIQRLYRESKNSVAREFEFAQRTLVPDMPGVSEAAGGGLTLPGAVKPGRRDHRTAQNYLPDVSTTRRVGTRRPLLWSIGLPDFGHLAGVGATATRGACLRDRRR